MKKYITAVTAALIASATLMIAGPAAAANVDIHVGVPLPIYVQPRPVYVHPQYENDWRERRVRASEWRADPRGHAVSASAHDRNDHRKSHKKHNKKHDKHGHRH